MKHTRYFLVAVLLSLLFTACQQAEPEALVIYSGRSEALVEGLVERFKAETGLPVEVRYGTDAQLLATLEEEGARSPADLFWANTTGALGAASNAGLLSQLPDSLLARPEAFVPSSGLWVPVTVRFRVLAYNPVRVNPDALPASVMDLPTLATFKGRLGWTPAYSSFQDFITAMRDLKGPDSTRAWLDGLKALEPKAYTSNTPMIQALVAGEIDLALTNHYYILRALYAGEEGEYEEDEDEDHEGEEHEEGGHEGEEHEAEGHADVPVATYHFAPGDVGNLALVTGAGLLKTSKHAATAERFLAFLLSPESQRYAAREVHEYPVRQVGQLPRYLLQEDEALRLSPSFDFDKLRDLDATLALLRAEGVL